MLLLECLILISVSLAILTTIILFFLLFSLFYNLKNIKKLKVKSRLKRRGQRKLYRKIEKLSAILKRNQKSILLNIALLVISVSVGGYSLYYQRSGMTKIDTENIISGYYLVGQIEQQLGLISQKKLLEKESELNIHTLAIKMASYSAKKSSDHQSKDGQLLLNKYYSEIGQLGVNLSSQNYSDLSEKKEIMVGYIKDLGSIKVIQTKVLNFYKINETSLNQIN